MELLAKIINGLNLFAKIVNSLQSLNILTKSFILDVLLGSNYASGINFKPQYTVPNRSEFNHLL